MGTIFNWKDKQNSDGGWAYSRGSSWTEPTVFVLLARAATEPVPLSGEAGQSVAAGVRFLRSLQRPDGGWQPQPGVMESTWVTSLVALLPESEIGARALRTATGWLRNQTGQESGWRYRLQQRMAGNKDQFPEAWPWFPGAAAWATPTTMGILALEKMRRRAAQGKSTEDGELQRRVNTAREFLLGRQCADGGWNHGSNRALGRDGDSYPETTGQVLLAFAGTGRSTAIDRATAAAHRHLAACRTAEGTSWLRLGLAAHAQPVKLGFTPVCRTNMDVALLALADANRNPFLT